MTAKNKNAKMKRATAAKLLEDVKRRILEVNGQELGFAYKITKAVVFGSFVNAIPCEQLSDLDIAVRLEPLYDRKSDKQRALESKRLEMCTSDDMLLRMYWPHEEVFRYIRGRNPYIAIHDYDANREVIETGDTIVELLIKPIDNPLDEECIAFLRTYNLALDIEHKAVDFGNAKYPIPIGLFGLYGSKLTDYCTSVQKTMLIDPRVPRASKVFLTEQ